MRVPRPPRLVKLAREVYAYLQPDGSWCLSNAGILLDREGSALLVDTLATEGRNLALKRTIDSLGATVSVIINTHFHGDHTFGNSLFGDVRIIGHPDTRSAMLRAGLHLTSLWPDVDWGQISIAPPNITVDRPVSVAHGDREVQLIPTGAAHTTNDILVHLPDDGVVFAGDIVMSGVTPFALMGSVSGTISALTFLHELSPRVVVGGHGDIADVHTIEDNISYFQRVETLAERGLAQRLLPLQVAISEGPGPFHSWLDAERLVANLHVAYAERSGGEIDVMRIFDEMASLSPTGRLTCCA